MSPSENPSTPVEFVAHLLIPHPERPALLIVPHGDAWAVPHVLPREPHFGVVAPLNGRVFDELGLRVVTLRCLGDDWAPGARRVNSIYELETLELAGALPAGGRWIERADLDGLPLAGPARCSVLEAWFDEQRRGRPRERRAWARPGWFSGVSRWMAGQARRLGLTPLGEVEQLRNWERSTLLRLPTSAGTLYYKAAPAPLAAEGALLLRLGERLDGEVPEVLVLDEARGGFLMHDMRARPLHETGDVAVFERAARRYGEVQRALSADPPRLPEYRTSDLADRVDGLLAALPSMTARLDDEQIDRLRAFGPRLKEMCRELAACGLPDTFEHGDFWPTNVAVRGGGFVFFDVSDATITHPFFGLRLFLANLDEYLPDTPDARVRVTAAYLSAWAGLTSDENLRRALALSTPLSALQAALLYIERLLPVMEAKWEMDGMALFALHDLLRALEADTP